MLCRNSHHSIPSRAMTATYLPRSPTYTRRRPKQHFQRSNLDMRLAQSHIHAELRALLSPADVDYARSDEYSGWITPRTRICIDLWPACARFDTRNGTYEPGTGTDPEELRVRSKSASNVRRIRCVCRAIYWICKEKPCGRTNS